VSTLDFARLQPMLALEAKAPFDDPLWGFEPKIDGFRALARVVDGRARLKSRRGLPLDDRFPEAAKALGDAVLPDEAVLDLEVAVLDDLGRPDFARTLAGEGAVTCFVFDVLERDGVALLDRPLAERKALLAASLLPTPGVTALELHAEHGREVFRAAVSLGFEGVVAKRLDAPYRPGERSRAWLKVKAVREADFVVGGATEGAGRVAGGIGALALGLFSGGSFVFQGLVGSGLSERSRAELERALAPHRVADPPFADPPRGVARWFRPAVVVRVRFLERTRDGRLRAPRYAGLRPDLDAPSLTVEGAFPAR